MAEAHIYVQYIDDENYRILDTLPSVNCPCSAHPRTGVGACGSAGGLEAEGMTDDQRNGMAGAHLQEQWEKWHPLPSTLLTDGLTDLLTDLSVLCVVCVYVCVLSSLGSLESSPLDYMEYQHNNTIQYNTIQYNTIQYNTIQ